MQQLAERAAGSISALIPIHAALPVFTRAAARGRLFVPALKPGLFPLPMLRCLLFLPSAFHSGFNSPQTLPNGFFTWGSEAAHRLPKISRTPRAQKGVFFLFPHFPPSPRPPHATLMVLFTPQTQKRVGGRQGPILTPGRERLCQQHPLEPVPSGTRSIPPALTRGTAFRSALGGRSDARMGSGGLHRPPAAVARVPSPPPRLPSPHLYPLPTALPPFPPCSPVARLW